MIDNIIKKFRIFKKHCFFFVLYIVKIKIYSYYVKCSYRPEYLVESFVPFLLLLFVFVVKVLVSLLFFFCFYFSKCHKSMFNSLLLKKVNVFFSFVLLTSFWLFFGISFQFLFLYTIFVLLLYFRFGFSLLTSQKFQFAFYFGIYNNNY